MQRTAAKTEVIRTGKGAIAEFKAHVKAAESAYVTEICSKLKGAMEEFLSHSSLTDKLLMAYILLEHRGQHLGERVVLPGVLLEAIGLRMGNLPDDVAATIEEAA